ncbi:histidinol-phosphate transaminase [Panacibacter ginsenosidivorans]|uniref:histidinol-phosphate transaminase n=1 Tax=Panacibacter ginsenosidivorans TaxID=1813871 RepID=A0A5B8VE07_9BACT|nr:histidinol-phosphate transaminase [Panacibacter ginsenosidivorans]QEC69231.1 histidinol-phosphate transaminase [Panacibacter ginsenosidivorans]
MKTNKKIIKLSANENFYGCSPLVQDAIKKYRWNDIHLYPDFLQASLKEQLADKFQVCAQNILLGMGTIGIIESIIRFLVKPGEEIITLERSFVAYWQLSQTHERKCNFAALTNFTCDINNILSCINNKTSVIFIANPNNPTGTIIPHDDLKNLLENISPKIFVVVDEAYNEYVTDPSYPDSLKLLAEFPNFIILRSFSKIYGLAGLRIGYGIAHEKVAAVLEQKRLPFSINSVASVAAIASLDDEAFIMSCKEKNETERAFLFSQLKKSGYSVLPTQANFIYLYFDNEAEKKMAYNRLYENGLQVCDLKSFHQDRSLRMVVADRTINDIIVYLLAKNKM